MIALVRRVMAKAVRGAPEPLDTKDRFILHCRLRVFAASHCLTFHAPAHLRTLYGHSLSFAVFSIVFAWFDKFAPLMFTLMMVEKVPALADELKPAPRKRGRKPGCGKVPGSGRKPGTPNRVPKNLRETILLRGRPIELLCDISRGVKIRVGPQGGPSEPQYEYPTLQERAAAAKILIDKLVPAAPPAPADDAGEPLHPREKEMTDIEIARAIAFALTRGERSGKTPAELAAMTRDAVETHAVKVGVGAQDVLAGHPGLSTPHPATAADRAATDELLDRERARNEELREQLRRPDQAERRQEPPNIVRFPRRDR